MHNACRIGDRSRADIVGDTSIHPTQPAVNRRRVEEIAEIITSDRADDYWGGVDFPIEIQHRPNGDYLVDGHHRFVASHLAGVEPPPGALIEETIPRDFPVPFEWKNVDWQK